MKRFEKPPCHVSGPSWSRALGWFLMLGVAGSGIAGDLQLPGTRGPLLAPDVRGLRGYPREAAELVEDPVEKRTSSELRAEPKSSDTPSESLKTPAERARAALRRGLVDEARQEYLQVLNRRPEDAEARFNLAGIALHENQPEVAQRHYRALLDDPVEGSDARYNLAVVSLQTGQLGEALNHLRDVVVARPAYAEARLLLASTLEDVGFIEEAASHFLEAAELVPEDPAPLAGQARLALREGRLDDALELYEAAADLDPQDAPLREKGGDVAHKLGHQAQARLHWLAAKKLLEVAEPDADKLVVRARLHQKLGEGSQAATLLRKALHQRPHHPEGLRIAPEVLGDQGASLARTAAGFENSLFDSGGSR